MKNSVIYFLILTIITNIAALPGRIFPSLRNGNALLYSVSVCKENKKSPLKGKKIIFLGSSVTFGSRSKEESFVDYLVKVDGVEAIKEAVSGTTLCDNGETSYVSRLKTIDKDFRADAFVCQLSTNDASLNLPLGTVSGSTDIDSFDTKTVAGAIEYIITYAREKWNCPVIFYTGTKYDSEAYAKMVELLGQIAEKQNIGVIDLWNNEKLNKALSEDFDFYMHDGIHPYRSGYNLLWLPEFEKYLSANI